MLVKLVHRDVDAGQHEAADDVGGGVDGGLQRLQLVVVEAAEHPLHLHAVGKIVADAHAQTGILLSDELLDVAEAVVSAV